MIVRIYKIGWTNFNQKHSIVDAEVTTIGYMPIIQSPAHELDSLKTVVLRCKHVVNALGQQQVVLTVDEALYYKLMELKWATKDYQNFLIVRLGGLHTILAFLNVIGKHINCSGLLQAWLESNVLGPRAAENIVNGKSYARGIGAHKLILQTMWHILMPQLLDFIGDKNGALKERIIEKSMQDHDLVGLISILESEEFTSVLNGFVVSKGNDINLVLIYRWYKFFFFLFVLKEMVSGASAYMLSSACCHYS